MRSQDHSPENPPRQLTLTVDPGPGADDEDRARLSQRLREELREVSESEVREVPRSGEAPRGARGAEMAWGTLAMTIAPGLITALITTLQAWLTRHERSSITLESGGEKLVVTGNPSQEEQRLIEVWVSSHKA